MFLVTYENMGLCLYIYRGIGSFEVLIYHASKTALMFLNLNLPKNDIREHDSISIMIGNIEVFNETSTKLLGIILDQNQKWKSQITV